MLSRYGLSVTIIAILVGCLQLVLQPDAEPSGSPHAPATDATCLAAAPAPVPVEEARAPIDARTVGAREQVFNAWFSGEQLQFADFNGDGTLDLFGWAANDRDTQQVAAFDGKTGDVLWSTPPLTTETYRSWMRLVHGHIVVVDASGVARAFRTDGSAALWATDLGERAEAMCEGHDGQVVVRTADRRVVGLDLTRGAAQPAALPRPCITDAVNLQAHVLTESSASEEYFRSRRRPTGVEGIAVKGVLSVSSQARVVWGDRTPGTRVPMIATLRSGEVAWMSPVPADEPLNAGFPMSAPASADESAAFIAYERGSDDWLAAFAVADGRRLWDIAVSDIQGIFPVEDRLYVAQLVSVTVLDRETGEVRYVVGRQGRG